MTSLAGKRTFARVAMLVAALWLVGSSTLSACPNCRDALASDPDQAGMIQGLFWSIMFLLSMPFLIFTALSGYFYWLVRSASRASNAPASASLAAGTHHEETDVSPFAHSESETLEPATV